MLIKNDEENAKAPHPADRRTTCSLCKRELCFPRLQVEQAVYHPVCGARLAASLNRDLQRLLESVIL